MKQDLPGYDCAVVGGGIAGLAVAEIFARCGRSVVLIERNEKLCQEASAEQHGWFHFGSLYSIFPQNQFLRTMIGGVEDLLDYYADFQGMNIAITSEGRLAFPQGAGCWFRNEPIEYIVCARNHPDFDMRSIHGLGEYGRKLFFLLTWELAIKQFISRHQRFHNHNWHGKVPASQWIPRAGWADYSREVITKPRNTDIRLDPDTHFRIVGFDRPMQAPAMVSDLLRSLIGAGGKVMTGTEVERLEKVEQGTLVHTNAGKVHAHTVVIAAGRWLGGFLGRSTRVKVVASPMLVAYPAVSEVNFVRMTPFVAKSVNHLHHRVEGSSYSLIGGGYFADPDNLEEVRKARGLLLDMARAVFPGLDRANVVETYFGYKTEIAVSSGERNYQYFIREVDRGVYAVIPGKFSLAFSLAVNAFKRITGEEPTAKLRLSDDESTKLLVGPTRHGGVVLDAIRAQREAPSLSRPLV